MMKLNIFFCILLSHQVLKHNISLDHDWLITPLHKSRSISHYIVIFMRRNHMNSNATRSKTYQCIMT
jgi:hypothetical protein